MVFKKTIRDHCGRDHMVVGFTTTCAINAYHHLSCEFEPWSWQGILDTTLCDKVCQWLEKGRWFPLGTPVSSNNKTDRHDITEILLKVALNTINQTINLKTTFSLHVWKLLCYSSFKRKNIKKWYFN
jgi:hypothetical protein